MMVSANRFRSIGWIALLLVCATLVMVLAFRVNGLRSQVHRTEQQIVALRKEKLYLETEVETRANQQQLKLWNDVEFGYVAPTASQYLANERQLAAFSKPDEPDAPAPIRVASVDDAVAAQAAFPAIVSSLTGEVGLTASTDSKTAVADEPAPRKSASAADHAAAADALGAKLATVGPVKKAAHAGQSGATKPGNAKTEKAASTKSAPARSHGDADARPGKGAKSATTAPAATGKAAKSAAKPAAKSAKPSKASKTTP